MRAWDFDKNVGVSPSDVPIRPRDNEQKKYYFKCPTCGESKLRNPRSIYKRGPICNSCKSKESWIKQGHQPKMMVADSEKLMSVWDAEKNVGMSPSDVPIHPSQGKEKNTISNVLNVVNQYCAHLRPYIDLVYYAIPV